MRVVIQRVSHASVTVAGETCGAIGPGLLVFLGIESADDATDGAWLSKKIVNLRIFADKQGVMNRSLKETGGDLLLVSQFTLHAATRKGNRPSYMRAAPAAVAVPLYEKMIRQLQQELGRPVATGRFGADMQVALCNDGPVTILMDSRDRT